MTRLPPVLTVVLCLLLHTARAQDALESTVDLDLNHVTLQQALNKLTVLTHVQFSYKTSDVQAVTIPDYHAHRQTARKVLTDLLTFGELTLEETNGYLLIRKINKLTAGKATLYGFVTSGQSGEALAGATITLNKGSRSILTAITNNYGFYSIAAPKGTYVMVCSYAGFRTLEKSLTIDRTMEYNVELTLNTHAELQTVEVSALSNKNSIRRTLTGYHRLSMAEIKKIAAAGGEPDVLKSLQLLPGIQTANEGTSNLSVRGGSYDQNLILLDEAPVYNPTHTLGMFSVFNSDALKDVSIYKGVFPAQYGGRLSSVVDIHMKEGNSKTPEASGGVGLLASRFTYEGPVQKDKSSFMLSGRYSDLGALLNGAHLIGLLKFQPTKSNVSFYDFNFKLNPILGNKDRLFLSAYAGHDLFYLNVIDQGNKMSWGNLTASARWNHVFNSRLFANTSLLYSRYNYSSTRLDDSRNYQWQANMQELTLKTDVDWMVSNGNTAKLGLGITYQNVLPGSVSPLTDSSIVKKVSLNNRSSALAFAYVNDEQQIGKRLNLNYGLRLTAFAALGDVRVYGYAGDGTTVTDSTYYGKGRVIKTYFGAEPRVNARWLLSDNHSLKISYGRNYQFQHLLNNSSVGLPTDIWLPSGKYFKPQYSDQFAIGSYYSFARNTYETSVELYYRTSHNVIDFKDNADIFLNDKIETQILTGRAKGYGLEGMLKKNKGTSTGWISYTYSKALRQIDGINNNQWYPPVYDHRHNFSVVYNWQWRPRLSFGANWVFRSGGYTTIPQGTYVYDGARFFYYGARNGYHLPDYHRLDLSATLEQHHKPRQKWQGQWVFSVYNAYNRENVFALFVGQDNIFYSTTKAQKIYLTGILPSVTYNFKF